MHKLHPHSRVSSFLDLGFPEMFIILPNTLVEVWGLILWKIFQYIFYVHKENWKSWIYNIAQQKTICIAAIKNQLISVNSSALISKIKLSS